MRKNLGLFGVVMVTVFLAASLIVPTTAFAWSIPEPLTWGDLYADEGAFDIVRYEFYEFYGYGMTPGGTGTTTGGDIIINVIPNYLSMPVDHFWGPPPPEWDEILANIDANLAHYATYGEIPPGCGPDCWTYDWSTIPQLYGADIYQGPGYDAPVQWDVLAGEIGTLETGGLAENVAGLKYYTLNDLATGFGPPHLDWWTEQALNAAWEDLCVPVPGTLFLLGGGLVGLVGARRFKNVQGKSPVLVKTQI